ncbi:cytochrome P450 [Jimgerdemannia flammicorona]|uniref:Cytochrome P450 n=1 Tax=Jimgerdemannia flammicorona TaxID=994334 RepID=A0A433B941_9FUNG|nr:cytochrome P450 [Jimgerdemannia flammicorona]
MPSVLLPLASTSRNEPESNSIDNPEGADVQIFNELVRGVNNPTYFLIPTFDRFPLGHRAGLHKKLEQFDRLIFDIIDKKREQLRCSGEIDEIKADLLTMMIRATDLEGAARGLSTKELRDNMSIFFLAGHDTTANAISCALYLLAVNPVSLSFVSPLSLPLAIATASILIPHILPQDAQDKARSEILSIMGDSDIDPNPSTIPTLEQTKSFFYLNLVMKETIRLCPSVMQLPARTVDKDTAMGDYVIPRGTQVLLNIYSIHHNKRYWGEDVEQFRPERFEEEGKRDPLAFLAFSYGSRAFRRYEIHLPADSPYKNGLSYGSGTLMHPINLRLQFKPRF